MPATTYTPVEDDIYHGDDGRYHVFTLLICDGPNKLSHHNFDGLCCAKAFKEALGLVVDGDVFVKRIDYLDPDTYKFSTTPDATEVRRGIRKINGTHNDRTRS